MTSSAVVTPSLTPSRDHPLPPLFIGPMHPSALLMSPRPYPTRLPQYVAALYGCMIVYASLEPFGAWMAPLPDTPFFLFAPWPRFTRSDLVINVLAYVPFGFF